MEGPRPLGPASLLRPPVSQKALLYTKPTLDNRSRSLTDKAYAPTPCTPAQITAFKLQGRKHRWRHKHHPFSIMIMMMSIIIQLLYGIESQTRGERQLTASKVVKMSNWPPPQPACSHVLHLEVAPGLPVQMNAIDAGSAPEWRGSLMTLLVPLCRSEAVTVRWVAFRGR